MALKSLTLTAKTLYAELLEHCIALGLWEHGVAANGTFTTKEVNGKRHYYFQFRELGQKTRQVYVGPDTPESRKIVESIKARRLGYEEEAESLIQAQQAFIGAGGWVMDHASFRIVKGFADAGLFSAGQGTAVLIGTLAFNILGNVLGMSWASNMRTEDIDFAAERHIAIGVPQPKEPAPSAVENLKMGYVPVPRLKPDVLETSYKVRGKRVRIDLLTPGDQGEVFPTQAFGAPALGMPYLDFLLAGAIPAVTFDRRESRVVSVPEPARFAVHKLLVSESREPFMRAKATKDREQAQQMLMYYKEEDPRAMEEALDEACQEGPDWAEKIQAALDKLDMGDLLPETKA